MAFLQCPECRLTVPASAYYLRGDECPRCLTAMEPCERFRREPRADAASLRADLDPGDTARAASA
jgi:hypothetical protein